MRLNHTADRKSIENDATCDEFNKWTEQIMGRGAGRHLHQQRGVGGRDGEVDKPAAKQHPAYKVREREHVVVVLK